MATVFGTVQLKRKWNYVAVLAPYRVLIDDVKVKRVRAGQVIRFDVVPGAHRMLVVGPRPFGKKSNEIVVEVPSGRVVNLECVTGGLRGVSRGRATPFSLDLREV